MTFGGHGLSISGDFSTIFSTLLQHISTYIHVIIHTHTHTVPVVSDLLTKSLILFCFKFYLL